MVCFFSLESLLLDILISSLNNRFFFLRFLLSLVRFIFQIDLLTFNLLSQISNLPSSFLVGSESGWLWVLFS